MKKKRARPGDHITIEYEDVIGGKIRTVAAYTLPPDADVKPYFLPGWNGLWDPADDGSNWLLFTTPAVEVGLHEKVIDTQSVVVGDGLSVGYYPPECLKHPPIQKVIDSPPFAGVARLAKPAPRLAKCHALLCPRIIALCSGQPSFFARRCSRCANSRSCRSRISQSGR